REAAPPPSASAPAEAEKIRRAHRSSTVVSARRAAAPAAGTDRGGPMRELVYYVAVSLDGYIAGPAHQFDAFLVEGDHMEAITAEFPDAIPTDIAAHLGIDQSGGRFDT